LKIATISLRLLQDTTRLADQIPQIGKGYQLFMLQQSNCNCRMDAEARSIV